MNKDSNNIDNSNIIDDKFDSASEKEHIGTEDTDSKKDSINIDIDKIIKDLQYYEKLKATIIEMQQSNNNNQSNLSNENSKNTSSNNTTCTCDDLETLLNKTNDTLLLIDSIKTEMCRLPLNPCQREYFNLYVAPLLTTMDLLSRVSYNIGISSVTVASSKELCVNKLEIQNNLNLIYCLNRKCTEIYCTLENNIDDLICKNINTN